MIRIKICCISSIDEAKLAIRNGVDTLGLVSAMPSGPAILDDETIASILGSLPEHIDSFLLTALTDADDIIRQHQRCPATTLQLVDAQSPGNYEKFRAALPGITLVQVIHVLDQKSVEEAIAVASYVDYLLLDSGNPRLQVKAFGGTGKTHDWRLSAEIVERVSCPVFLAGGLSPDNVKDAIDKVQPFGVDVCSRLRRNQTLNEELLQAFIAAVRT